ncbi:metallophosphoesterase [Geobacter argillaceus]|uniref:Calcineurin-like phosphoesterase domain-containing protein n=1 Tax=Geobacter argillaceus TaxID=345631 RepID=A0A562VIH9_9BACT|nr:metallophosphoesterase [Geobacter argillaceus]TWJ17756.1 hypothetical protein JN12_02873 [Geobacter argillaceus]
MTLFVITFLTIYGSAHGYFFLKARAAGIGTPALALFLIVMVSAPILVRVLERAGHETVARVMAYVGYCWMGFLFLFVVSAALLDLGRLLTWLAGALLRRDSPLPLAGTTGFLLPCCLALGIGIYGWFEALDIRQERVTLVTAKLPPGIERLRIVQISDVHVGLIVREERIRQIIAVIREANPDILVSTGDLVDGHVSHFNGIAELFRELHPRYGAFAITGNHEYYAGIAQANAFTERAGFTLLPGRTRDVAGMITIAGVDDPAASRFGPAKQEKEATLLGPLPRHRFTLLLKHRPVVDPTSVGLYDLQLSGHVHKGQIFPFTLLTYLTFPVHAGLTRLSAGSNLYVSRGTGTWGPPIRFLAPPEVTIIDLVPARH